MPTQSRTSRLERWGTMAAAAAIVAYGLRRRGTAGIGAALAATPLAYRGLTGHWPDLSSGAGRQTGDTRAALAGDRGIHVREAIRLEKPLNDVFRFWRSFGNLPRFMTSLSSVTELDAGRSHWVARMPGGRTVEWDAEIINEVPDKLIAWRSLPGSEVITAGSVNFSPVRGGRSTQVAVHLQYATPSGRAGAFVARLLGGEPSQIVREDMRRLKQFLEAGEIPRTRAERVAG